jgi:branched-chain amino acid transport system permease protein
MYVAMIIIGGLGLVRGAVLGAIFVTALPPVLRTILGDDVHVLGFNAPQLNLVVFGLAIVVFLIAAPGGLARFNLRVGSWRAANSPDQVVSAIESKKQQDPTKTMECA